MDECMVVAVIEYANEMTLYTTSEEHVLYVIIDYTHVPFAGSILKHDNHYVSIGDKEYTSRFKSGSYILTENWEDVTITKCVHTVWGTFHINNILLEDRAWRLYTFLDSVYTRGQSLERAIYLLELFGVIIKSELK